MVEIDNNRAPYSGFLDLVNFSNRQELFNSVCECWLNGKGFTLATLNLDHVVKMRDNPDFHACYRAHTHIVADGNPIVWLSRLAGKPVELMPGSELIAPLCALAAENGVGVAMIGGTKDTLEAAATRLMETYPSLRIVAKIAPEYGFDPFSSEADTCLHAIRDSGAKLCFLALGAPKQELLAVRGSTVAPGCGFASIGAGLDFIAGQQTRAPQWIRSLALEWLWRMISNPRRLVVRYLRCILILPSLTTQAILVRFKP